MAVHEVAGRLLAGVSRGGQITFRKPASGRSWPAGPFPAPLFPLSIRQSYSRSCSRFGNEQVFVLQQKVDVREKFLHHRSHLNRAFEVQSGKESHVGSQFLQSTLGGSSILEWQLIVVVGEDLSAFESSLSSSST